MYFVCSDLTCSPASAAAENSIAIPASAPPRCPCTARCTALQHLVPCCNMLDHAAPGLPHSVRAYTVRAYTDYAAHGALWQRQCADVQSYSLQHSTHSCR